MAVGRAGRGHRRPADRRPPDHRCATAHLGTRPGVSSRPRRPPLSARPATGPGAAVDALSRGPAATHSPAGSGSLARPAACPGRPPPSRGRVPWMVLTWDARPASRPVQRTPRKGTRGMPTTPARTIQPTLATPPKPPTTRAPSESAKTTSCKWSGSSSPPACSDPAGPPCSPHGCPPPPPRTPPAVSRKPPHCASGCARLTPRRTPTPAKSSTWPASRKTHPRLPRCGPGSSNDSATWNRTHADQRPAHRLGPRRRHQQRPVTPGRLAHARRHPRRCPRQPPGPPVRRIGLELIYKQTRPPGQHLRHHHPQHPGHPGRHHRRQRAPRRTGRPGRIGPFPATPQIAMVSATVTNAAAAAGPDGLRSVAAWADARARRPRGARSESAGGGGHRCLAARDRTGRAGRRASRDSQSTTRAGCRASSSRGAGRAGVSHQPGVRAPVGARDAPVAAHPGR